MIKEVQKGEAESHKEDGLKDIPKEVTDKGRVKDSKVETPKVSIDEYLNDPKNKAKARREAEFIRDQVSKNWFDMTRFIKKTRQDRKYLIQVIQMLMEFGLMLSRLERGKTLFKVVFDTYTEVDLIDDELEQLKLRIKILNNKKVALKKRQKEIDKEEKKQKRLEEKQTKKNVEVIKKSLKK